MYASHLGGEVNLQIVVDEGDVLAGDEAPAVLLDFSKADAAIEFWLLIMCAIDAFALPRMVDTRRPLNLLRTQADLLFVLVLDGVLRLGTQIHEENLMIRRL